MSNFHFRLMSFLFNIRDLLQPRKKILEELRIKSGYHILDYGTGSGSYTLVAARLVGENGKVFALDIHPLSIKMINDKATKNGFKNIRTILSDCATGLSGNSMDLVFLHDIYHDLTEPGKVLEEIARVLKPDGILSFNDHHIKEENEIVSEVTGKGSFKLSRKGERVYNFLKIH